jgi:hypothetical protein
MNCARCGSELEADARFCGVCGTPVVDTAQPPGPPPLPASAPAAQAGVTAPLYPPPPPPTAPDVSATAPMPVAHAANTRLGPPPLPASGSVLAPPGSVPASGAPAGSGIPAGLIVALILGGVLFVGALGVGGFFVAKQFGFFGGGGGAATTAEPSTTPGSGDAASAVVSGDATPTDTAAQPETTTPLPPPQPTVTPAGTVLNLKDRPSDPAKAAIRQQLLDAARKRLRTKSRFFVNQLWVDGEWAIGEIGAEKGGHRIWVVWRGTPRKAVYVGNWGTTDEMSLKSHVGAMPPELLARIDWTKRWPKEFKFVR